MFSFRKFQILSCAALGQLTAVCILATALFLASSASAQPALGSPADLSTLTTGADIFQKACQACHGADGRGAPLSQTGFSIPLPDFTECSFASREATGDWVGIAHQGGPLRGFSEMMPAFGKALTKAQLTAAIEYIQKFCTDPAWPRGEFNLPRPLLTGKAFIEDEAIVTSSLTTPGNNVFSNKLIFEKRLGARSEFELLVPVGWEQNFTGDNWSGHIGDIGLELKHVLYDNVARGSILSIYSELALPTGDAASGWGKDTVILEPGLLYAQLLPADAFLQTQFGFELPADLNKADREMVWRAAFGKSIQEPNWGRTWTPILEIVGGRELDNAGTTQWDVVPQMNISLSKRQHIQFNVGVRLPVTDAGPRSPELLFYFLWDWFDGSLRDGW
ncbi:MAG: c-type cytochrome [Pseudohongiellaceae bacterium]